MPKARKRKIPVTINSLGAASSNPHSSRSLIRKFHVQLKKQAQLRSDPQNATKLAEVDQELENMGGLSAYQRMSAIGQGNDRGGGSEKVLISWLRGLGFPNAEQQSKLRLLEVGALKPDNYLSCSSWIETTPIDLRSRHPAIKDQDFLKMSLSEHKESWDIISLSLVLNFVPEPKDRGRMLMLAQAMLSPNGLLFLVLPLPCVANSRYLDFGHFKAILTTIGLTEVKEKWKSGGKMAYWLYRKVGRTLEDPENIPGQFKKKTVIRQGNRNNFAILL